MELKNILGDYHQQILQAVDDYGYSSPNWNYDYFLYNCKGGSNGDIEIVEHCKNGCRNGGSNKSDSCK
jgi:hypothetical protein